VQDIEVPGQYSGKHKPDPMQHAKISNFDDRVLVMSSLRKPKRIRIYGTDEKEYLFLVKVNAEEVIVSEEDVEINVLVTGRRGLAT
jgi:phosphatidylinositol kinase/protein kinase (PI-3  family)